MPGCEITPPSSHCIVLGWFLLLLLLPLPVGFIPPEETHNVTPHSVTDECKKCNVVLGERGGGGGGDGEQFPTKK